MPTGIVTILPPPFAERVQLLWDGLNREFGISTSAESTAFPHITFHVATSYTQPPLQQELTNWAKTAFARTIRTWGVGVFSGDRTVIFIGVTRTKQISSLHESIYAIGQRYAVNPVPIFAPTTWVPHVTLAHLTISAEILGPLIAWLDQYEFIWEFPINTLSIIRSMSSQPTTNFTVEFG